MASFTLSLPSLLLLLLLHLPLFSSVTAESHKKSNGSMILQLLNRKISSGSGIRPASKLPFHHNVSLTVTIQVGSPPQPVSMVLDTGSELSWLHCKKTPGLNSVFEPGRSKSYSRIPCTSPICTSRTRDFNIPASCDSNKLCHAAISYADATSMEGTLSMDTLRVGPSPLPGIVFGCMETGFTSSSEEDSKTTGLLGMNRGSLSFVTQMGYRKFSYCISGHDSSGVLLFGEAHFPWLKPLSYTPLVKASTQIRLPYFDPVAYSVHLEGIKVGSKLLALPKSIFEPDHTGAGQTMVDSGTQFTYLLGPAYTALKNEFMAQTKGVLRVEPDFVFESAMDLCYRIPLTQRLMPALPTVTLVFEGAEMTVAAEQLLYRVPGSDRGSDGVHCFTFGNSDMLGVEAYLVGNHHQQNMWMEFDLERSRVGLAQVRCDLASQRLGVGL